MDAFILEAQFIKEHQPRFNVLFKDGSALYIPAIYPWPDRHLKLFVIKLKRASILGHFYTKPMHAEYMLIYKKLLTEMV